MGKRAAIIAITRIRNRAFEIPPTGGAPAVAAMLQQPVAVVKPRRAPLLLAGKGGAFGKLAIAQ
jgi:hypothetical protein